VSVSYDGNGNLLNDGAHNYTWDGNWGIPSTIDSVSLTYDALGRMVEQNRGGNYTQVVYSPSGAKLALMNQQTLSKAFVPLPGGATAVYTNGSNGVSLTYYRHPDWLGSSRLATTPGRTVYSYSAYAPFGENYGTAVSPQGSDLSFTGQNQDTVSGLYDFPFREYSPAQGRWISPDPAGPNAVDPTNPQSWNRYAYVGNSPLSSIDPYGLRDCLALDGSGSVLHNCVDTSSQNPDDVDPANPGGVPGILGGRVRLIIDGWFSGYIYVGPGNPAPGTPCAPGGTLPGQQGASGGVGTSTPPNNCTTQTMLVTSYNDVGRTADRTQAGPGTVAVANVNPFTGPGPWPPYPMGSSVNVSNNPDPNGPPLNSYFFVNARGYQGTVHDTGSGWDSAVLRFKNGRVSRHNNVPPGQWVDIWLPGKAATQWGKRWRQVTICKP
jgi:RHS repeat-associated protein